MGRYAVAPVDSTVRPYTLDDLIADIRPGYSFSRYGDGEWKLILNAPALHTGSRSQVFTDDLREAMRQTLLQHNGVTLGMQHVLYLQQCRLFHPALDWMRGNGLAHLPWVDAEVLHRASADGELPRLIDAIRGSEIVTIGPDYFSALPFPARQITIPERNAWSDLERIYAEASTLRDCVVLVSAGPLAKVLVHRLHALGNGCAIIDTGSVLDPYCGVRSRRYMRDISFPALA
jgi:hypothetical protein